MPQETDRQEKMMHEISSPAFEAEGNVVFLKTSGQAADRISFAGLSPLNENELKSVYALLSYVAYNRHMQKNAVETVVAEKFHVNQVEQLPQKDYEEVIRFLVDLCTNELLN